MIEQQIVNGVSLGSVYAMVAVAMTLSIGVLNFLNFSIPGLFMIAGMVCWAALSGGLPWPVAVLLAFLTVAVCSIVVELLTWRWLRSAPHVVPLVSSMAFLLLFENIALVLWGSDVRSISLQAASVTLKIGTLSISVTQLCGLVVSALFVSCLIAFLQRTRIGRAVRVIAEDPDTATLLGVDVSRLAVVVFVVAGLFAAFAGLLFIVSYRQVQPFIGEAVGLKGISAMIVGGMGNIWGAIVGGLLIGLSEVLAIAYFGADYVDIFVFGLLLAVLIFRPTGLLRGTSAARFGI